MLGLHALGNCCLNKPNRTSIRTIHDPRTEDYPFELAKTVTTLTAITPPTSPTLPPPLPGLAQSGR
jgi:hypothetical protein